MNEYLPKALVIGSGFGGIGAALRLRALGYHVDLVERLDGLGGRAQVFEKDGFRHDAGPTVITAPFMFEDLFSLFDEKLSDHLEFVPVSPWYRFHFPDGSDFDYGDDMAAFEAGMAKYREADIEGYRRLLDASREIFEVGFEKLADQPFLKFTDMLKQIPALLKLRSDLTVSQFVKKYITHPYLQQALSIHPLLVGGNPYDTTSIYALIHYLERKWGVHFCMGGTGKLVTELEKLMRRHGVAIHTGADVEEIVVSGKKVTGIKCTDGREMEADLVVCNADPPTVYREMMPVGGKSFLRPKKIIPEALTKYSMGLYVLYFGTTRQYPDVAHHTIWLGERFKGLLNDIFNKQIATDDFSLYLHRPTATDPSFAPEGCDSFYILCPVPNLQGNIDWDVYGSELRDRIVKALSETIMPDLESHVTADFWMHPGDFEKQYRATHGAGFSIAPVFRQSAWFRYHNRDPDIGNLYFVGAGTHPGAGLPGVLSSAKALEKMIPAQSNLQSQSYSDELASDVLAEAGE